MKLNKKIVDKINKSTDRQWLLRRMRWFYNNAKISRLCAFGDNDYQKDYEEQTIYGDMCSNRLLLLRLLEHREAKQERNTENEKV